VISKIKIKHIEGVMVDCQIYSLGTSNEWTSLNNHTNYVRAV